MDIFYVYLIQCLKRKEKIEKRRENLCIQRKRVAFSILEDHLENAAGAIDNGIFSIYRIQNSLEDTVGDSVSILHSSTQLLLHVSISTSIIETNNSTMAVDICARLCSFLYRKEYFTGRRAASRRTWSRRRRTTLWIPTTR
jgi:hypothetical protein